MYSNIERLRSQYCASELCRTLGVSKSGYYAWRKRPESARRREDRRLLFWIRATFKKSRGSYGARRLHRDLRNRGQTCSRHRAARLAREAGMRAKKSRRYRATTDSGHGKPVAPNVLNREFEVTELNRRWAADITYLRCRRGFAYLSVVMDLASRRIVGWSVDSTLHARGALRALDRALAHRGVAPGWLHHSDRGSQFVSHAYRGRLESEVDTGIKVGCNTAEALGFDFGVITALAIASADMDPCWAGAIYLQFRSRQGCEVGAILFSRCESATLQSVPPHRYLRASNRRTRARHPALPADL